MEHAHEGGATSARAPSRWGLYGEPGKDAGVAVWTPPRSKGPHGGKVKWKRDREGDRVARYSCGAKGGCYACLAADRELKGTRCGFRDSDGRRCVWNEGHSLRSDAYPDYYPDHLVLCAEEETNVQAALAAGTVVPS